MTGQEKTPRGVLPGVLIVSGLLLLTISCLWPRMFPADRYWNDEHEEQLEQISQLVHDRMYRVRQAQETGEELDPEFLAEYERATGQGNALRQQSDLARTRPARIAARWRWGAAVFLAGGIGLWVRARNAGV